MCENLPARMLVVAPLFVGLHVRPPMKQTLRAAARQQSFQHDAKDCATKPSAWSPSLRPLGDGGLRNEVGAGDRGTFQRVFHPVIQARPSTKWRMTSS